MKKKLLALLMACVMIVAALGCATEVQTTGSAEKADTSWDDIKAKGYYLVNRNDGYLPMTFRDESNENVGFDVDLANAVGEYLGIEARPAYSDWDSKLIVLNGHDADVIWCGFTITDERREQVIFTDPYIGNTQIIVVMANSDINSKADLAGKTLGWQLGSSCEGPIREDPIYGELAGERTYATMTEPLMDMQNGRIDAVVCDSLLFGYWSTQQGNADQFKVLTDNFGDEYMGVGCRLEDKAWAEKLNEALMHVIHSEEGIAISEKWFGRNVFEDLPGYNG